jgi:hypothetical protein
MYKQVGNAVPPLLGAAAGFGVLACDKAVRPEFYTTPLEHPTPQWPIRVKWANQPNYSGRDDEVIYEEDDEDSPLDAEEDSDSDFLEAEEAADIDAMQQDQAKPDEVIEPPKIDVQTDEVEPMDVDTPLKVNGEDDEKVDAAGMDGDGDAADSDSDEDSLDGDELVKVERLELKAYHNMGILEDVEVTEVMVDVVEDEEDEEEDDQDAAPTEAKPRSGRPSLANAAPRVEPPALAEAEAQDGNANNDSAEVDDEPARDASAAVEADVITEQQSERQQPDVVMSEEAPMSPTFNDPASPQAPATDVAVAAVETSEQQPQVRTSRRASERVAAGSKEKQKKKRYRQVVIRPKIEVGETEDLEDDALAASTNDELIALLAFVEQNKGKKFDSSMTGIDHNGMDVVDQQHQRANSN